MLGQWNDVAVNDFRVAAYADSRAGHVAPETKRHAYLVGATTTACGFGLDAMRRFADLRFCGQIASVRCPLCARVVAGHH